MDRKIVYPAAIPLETDILGTNKNVLVALGHILQDMLGTATLFSGLACVPTTPAGMTVNVNPGRAYSYQATDAGAYSSLAADAHQIVKQGILLDAVNFACPAPTTAGFSISYLIEGAFQEVDKDSVVLPYYNASNPAQAYSGPNGNGTSNTTTRADTVQLQLKAGVAATSGSQVIPTPDAGFNGLWVVTVPYGAPSITTAMISQYAGAPFIGSSLLSQLQVLGPSTARVQGLIGGTNATTPTTKFDIQALGVTLRNPTTGATLVFNNTATLTNDITVAGPAANGRDQAGVFSASSDVHLYFISDGTNLATISSANAPSVGPAALPTGYTYWAYATSLKVNASINFIPCYQRGARVSYASAFGLGAGAATTLTSVSLVNAIPAIAETWEFISTNLAISPASGSFSITCNLAVVGTSIIHSFGLQGSSTSIGGVAGPAKLMPNVNRNFAYQIIVGVGTGPTVSLGVGGYNVPNGDN